MAEILTPMKAIRAKCLDCMCGSSHEVHLCPCTDCSLWRYRDGHNPARKGLGGPGTFQKTNSSTENRGNLGISEPGDETDE